MWSVDITTDPVFSVGKERKLFEGDYEMANPVRNYDVTPDGQRFLMIMPSPRPEKPVTQLHVTLNWFEELKRLVPLD